MSISGLRDPLTRQSLGVGSILSAGIASGLAWQPSAGLYSATLAVPSVTSASVVTASIQGGTDADCVYNWLVRATPNDFGIITFYIADSGAGLSPPQTPATFAIAWQIHPQSA